MTYQILRVCTLVFPTIKIIKNLYDRMYRGTLVKDTSLGIKKPFVALIPINTMKPSVYTICVIGLIYLRIMKRVGCREYTIRNVRVIFRLSSSKITYMGVTITILATTSTSRNGPDITIVVGSCTQIGTPGSKIVLGEKIPVTSGDQTLKIIPESYKKYKIRCTCTYAQVTRVRVGIYFAIVFGTKGS